MDLTIYGAGVLGLSIAYCCLKQGARVRVIDPNGVASGASGGIVGALAPHTPDNWNPKKQFQFESLILAREFWQGVEQVSGQATGYAPFGRLTPILKDKQIPLAEARKEAAQTNWQDQASWSVEDVRHLGDWTPTAPSGLVIKDTLSAHIHPRQATHSLGQAVQSLGGTITTAGARQGIVVDATGWAGLQTLSRDLDAEIGSGEKGQAALLEYNAKGQPQLFADGLHIIPHVDGTVAIGSTSERRFKSPTKTDGQLDDIVARAKNLFPVLQGSAVIERWAGVRPRASTRAPILGKHPLKDDHFIANGGYKIGFGLAPKIGMVMADLILNNIDEIPESFKLQIAKD